MTMKILIVDDEPDVQRLFEQRFRREKRKGEVDLHFAHSGAEAIHFLQDGGDKNLTLILSDINMPEMSGLELLKIIREQYPEMKMFMVTAYGDEQNREKAIGLGANEYLTKPLDFNFLKSKIMVSYE